jgi:hypothetical protein
MDRVVGFEPTTSSLYSLSKDTAIGKEGDEKINFLIKLMGRMNDIGK